MRSNRLCLFLWCLTTSALAAQSSPDRPSAVVPIGTPAVPLSEQMYTEILDREGPNARYRAAEQAVQQCETPETEFCAKLYNLLAEEAYMGNTYERARAYYHYILTTTFEDDYYQKGLLASRMRLNALKGLRNMAMNEAHYDTALVWHEQYVDSLKAYMGHESQRYQQDIDRTYALCYQQTGESEKAIQHLAAHAFGSPSGALEFTLNKEMVDALTELLRTKYPKRAYKKELQYLATAIHTEEQEGELRFYLRIFENKIYFRNDSANFGELVAQNPQLQGQAIAHYQRKLLNSYFYQSLMRQY